MRSLLSSLLLCFALSAFSQNWRDSLTMLGKAIEKHPYSTDLRLRKAAVNIELGQWDYAAEEYGRVLQIDSKNLAALHFRGYVNVQLRRYDLARQDYETFLSFMPKHFETQLALATVLQKMGQKERAFDELNRLVLQFPDSATAWAARASFEQEHNMREVALMDWEKAIALAPDNQDYKATLEAVSASAAKKPRRRQQPR